jgi:hypothetical protein
MSSTYGLAEQASTIIRAFHNKKITVSAHKNSTSSTDADDSAKGQKGSTTTASTAATATNGSSNSKAASSFHAAISLLIATSSIALAVMF